jgi:predicted acyltransferase
MTRVAASLPVAPQVVAVPTGAALLPQRLTSLDAFRGATMLLMASELMHLPAALKSLPAFAESPALQAIAHQLDHLEWAGCTLWDMIQPSFTFMVGVALPFSLASRIGRGDSFGKMLVRALWRALLLVALGIFLRSTGREQTNFTFEDTLTQIGLGYPFLFLLGFVRPRWQFAALVAVLVGYWAAFALYPLPPDGFDYWTVGVPNGWPHLYDGFLAHWNKNTNFAAATDVWFLNLFPRKVPFEYNGGGYLTLSFIPTLGTMILGLLAGNWIRSPRTHRAKVAGLIAAGVIGIVAGELLERLGVCPIVKRIWTPAWTLYSGGVAAIALAVFYALIDWPGWKRWAFPMVVVGMNSIAMYVLVHSFAGFISGNLRTHLEQDIFTQFNYTQQHGGDWSRVAQGAAELLVLWLILWWMYRRRIFLRL